jgi:hypothetical protein
MFQTKQITFILINHLPQSLSPLAGADVQASNVNWSKPPQTKKKTHTQKKHKYKHWIFFTVRKL